MIVIPVWSPEGSWQALLAPDGSCAPDSAVLTECPVPWWCAQPIESGACSGFDVVDFDPEQPVDAAGKVLRASAYQLVSASYQRSFLAQRVGTTGLWMTGVDDQHRMDIAARYKPDAVFGMFWREPIARQGGADRGVLMRLLERVSADAADRELESLVSGSPSLQLGLLRLVNAASISGGRRISGIGHALSILGRRQLQRWLMLLLYAERYQAHELFNPRLLMVCLRSRLMEMICRHLGGELGPMADLAFLTGMLSLLDLVTDMPRTQLFKSLALAEQGEAALVNGTGPLAPVLRLAEAAESADAKAVADALAVLGMSAEQWRQALQESWCWLAKLREEG